MIFFPSPAELYTPKYDLGEYLSDKDTPINKKLYEAMSRFATMCFDATVGIKTIKVHLKKDLLFYFNEAYALCTKVSIDAYPESHFFEEYWDEMSLKREEVLDKYFVLSIAYVLLAVNVKVRKQYKGMLNSIFYFLKQNFPYFLQWSFPNEIMKAYEEKQKNILDFYPMASLDDYGEIDPKLGLPKDDKEQDEMFREVRITVLDHISLLSKEKNKEENTKSATPPQEQDTSAVTKRFTNQQIVIFFYYLFNELGVNFENKTKSEWAELIASVSGYSKNNILEKLYFQSRIRDKGIVRDITFVSQVIKSMFPDIAQKMLNEISE